MIIITGQTATGKTQLALKYAKLHEGELIVCDSRQVYKNLNIITGKDIPVNQLKFNLIRRINQFDIGFYSYAKTKIWLYDVVNPNQYFSSFDWIKCAKVVINEVKKRKKTPIIVGGSYFYLRHLIYGIATENIEPNWLLRKKLAKKTVEELQEIIKKINQPFFNQLNESDKNNPHRLIRKIEILKSGKLSFLSKQSEKMMIYPQIFLGLRFKNKEDLILAVKQRVQKRLNLGAIEEVKQILNQGFEPTDPGLNAIGYRQIILYLKGKITKDEAIEEWIKAEVQYAKRQYTFMKKDKNIKWQEV
jgi:tRNA dimethylallyltransferase